MRRSRRSGCRATGIEQALKVAYARGADRVVLVDAGEIDPYDSRTVGARVRAGVPRAVARPRRSIGVQTPQDVFGQTAPYLAAELGWPQASVVVGVTVGDGDARVSAGVRRRAPRGARPEAAGGRRRAVRERAAALRLDGASAPGDERGEHARRSSVSVERAGRDAEARLARAAGAAGGRDDARGRRRRTWPRRSQRCCANGEL